MSAKTETNPLALLQQAIPHGHWRFVTDEEVPAAVAALAQVVGKAQSKLPSWQRRLAITADGKTHLAVVESCSWRDPSSICGWVDTDLHACTGTPTALPIEAAVALLASPQNPEKELARRRKLAAELEAKETAKREATKRAEAETAAAKAKDAAERSRFHAAAWAALSPAHRMLLRFALAAADREPELAADLRLAVAASLRPDDASDFPRAPWWGSIDPTAMPRVLTEAEQHQQSVLATIPPDRLVILKCLHGDNPAKIARHWSEIQERRA